MNKDEESMPVLLFLLNNNRFSELIRAVLNPKVSFNLLDQYGNPPRKFSQSQEFHISRSVSRFTIGQLIELKGSRQHSVKQYQNIALQEMIRRRLLIEGVTPSTRKSLWKQFTEFYQKPYFYGQLQHLEIGQDFINIIEKDILRTNTQEKNRHHARQVLQIFAHYNPFIGYCQGMNTIVVFLLEQSFSCDETFFILKKVTQSILPCDFYSNMQNLMVYTRIFYEMLAVTHPDIYAHMRQICLEMESTYALMVSFVLQWFVCLFCNENVNQIITQVIWDFLLVDGIVVLFKAALGYIDLLKPYILKCKDFESYNIMQKERIRQITDVEHIKKRITQTFISSQLLFLLKEKLIQPDQDTETKKPKKQCTSFKKSCHRRLNVCFQALEDNLTENKCYDIFVFKPNTQVNIIGNYMESLNRQYFHKEKPRAEVDKLIIGRIPHVCRYSSDTLTEGTLSDKNNGENSPRKGSTQSTPKEVKTPSKESEKKIREKVCEKIAELGMKKPSMSRSESMMFMEQMVRNASISNLLELYDIDELFQ